MNNDRRFGFNREEPNRKDPYWVFNQADPMYNDRMFGPGQDPMSAFNQGNSDSDPMSGYDPTDPFDVTEDMLKSNPANSHCGRVGSFNCIKQGIYVGKGGYHRTLSFLAVSSGAGEYTFESTCWPGYFLTVD